MKVKWTEQTTLDFVKLYGKHECLWNPNHSGYKIKKNRDKAYEEMSYEFKKVCRIPMSKLEIKVKVKNLRTTYMQQVHKIMKKSSPDYIYVPTLFWFEEMDKYLQSVPVNRSSERYILPCVIDNGSSIQKPLDPDMLNGNTNDTLSDPLTTNSDEDSKFVNTEPTELEQIELLPSKIRKKKMKFKLRNVKDPSRYIKVEHNIKDSNIPAEDEFDIYGKYLASLLRKMELQKALRLQLAIQNLVSEARCPGISNTETV